MTSAGTTLLPSHLKGLLQPVAVHLVHRSSCLLRGELFLFAGARCTGVYMRKALEPVCKVRQGDLLGYAWQNPLENVSFDCFTLTINQV